MRKLTRYIAALGGILCGISAATAAEHEEALSAVPSGQSLSIQDQILQTRPDGTATARFRFVMPALADGAGFDEVERDFLHLCENVAMPEILSAPEQVDTVVISLAAFPIEFGASRPDVVQFFEAFRIEHDRCIWEAF